MTLLTYFSVYQVPRLT